MCMPHPSERRGGADPAQRRERRLQILVFHDRADAQIEADDDEQHGERGIELRYGVGFSCLRQPFAPIAPTTLAMTDDTILSMRVPAVSRKKVTATSTADT